MKPAFVCDYCGKVGNEEFIKKHEKACLYNPDNQTCYSCAHYRIMNNDKYNPRCCKGIDVGFRCLYFTDCELWQKVDDIQERSYHWERR